MLGEVLKNLLSYRNPPRAGLNESAYSVILSESEESRSPTDVLLSFSESDISMSDKLIKKIAGIVRAM